MQASHLFRVDYQGGDGNDLELTSLGSGYVWDGTADGGAPSGNSNWSTATNWVGDLAPVDNVPSGAFLTFVFDGNTNVNTNVDIGPTNPGTNGINVNDLEFTPDAGAFTLSGNRSLDMLGRSFNPASPVGTADITNFSTATQTINVDMFHRSDFNTGLVFDAAAGDIVMGGRILDRAGSTAPVTITGPNTVTLSGTNNYQDPTVIDPASTLLLDGTHTGTGLYTVSAGATFGGTGSTAAAISMAGTIGAGSPTSAVESLGTGTLTLTGGTFEAQIGADTGTVAGTSNDVINVTGGVNLGTGTTLSVSSLGNLPSSATGVYTLIDNDGTGDTTTGNFVGLSDGDVAITVGGVDFLIYYNGGDGNDVVLVEKDTPSVIYVNDDWTRSPEWLMVTRRPLRWKPPTWG